MALVSSPDSRNFICGNICLKHAGATVYREAGYTGGLGGTSKHKNFCRDCTSITLSILKTLNPRRSLLQALLNFANVG